MLAEHPKGLDTLESITDVGTLALTWKRTRTCPISTASST